MKPLILQGKNLGDRHKYYNEQVNKAIKCKIPFEEVKNESVSDIDAFFKIDIASNCKNVDYIIEILKSEDMLHVSRAIKQSTWLVTEKQYEHIVNPQYLHDQLFPHMTTKAVNKFLLHIRLNLKDEARVEVFFKYYEQLDMKIAMKWLPNCSIAVIEKALETHGKHVSVDLFKRLCEKSVTILDVYTKNNAFKRIPGYIESVKFILNTDTEKFLDATEKQYCRIKYGQKKTALIMNRCKDRVLNNFEKFAWNIDLATFAKCLGKENIKEFLIKQSRNEKLKSWFRYENLRPIIKIMPTEGKFEFLKSQFINNTFSNDADIGYSDSCEMPRYILRCASRPMQHSASVCMSQKTSNEYQWYRHAPFDIAFPELKKIIRLESSHDERVAILSVMISCAGSNADHIETVLKYYCEKHINEPFKFKIQFVNNLIAKTNAFRYDERRWKLLEVLFHSLEVFIESDVKVQKCVEAVIVYKTIRKELVPKIIQDKFLFNTMQKYERKLTKEEKERLYSYLFKFLATKMNKTVTGQEEFGVAMDLVHKMVALIIDWNKYIDQCPFVLNRIAYLLEVNKENGWQADFAAIFNKKKHWKKYMFEESLLISLSEEACLNALKHDPGLLKRSKTEVDILKYNENITLRKLLSKLRIYWNDSLRQEWTLEYKAKLEQKGSHKAVTRGLFTLINPVELQEIVRQYAPKNSKIDWSGGNELQISVQKNIARNMHYARPQPSPELIMLYLKGDYLQYALSSLSSVFNNLSPQKSCEHLPMILDTPASVRKHGIRFAFSKLTSTELQETLPKIWASTNNASIREVIFHNTFLLLTRQKNSEKAKEVWNVLQIFLEKLTENENKSIFAQLSKIEKVPRVIQGEFCVKSYNYLKSLPAKADCEKYLKKLAAFTANIIDIIDIKFIETILLEYIEYNFTQKKIFENHGIRFHMVKVISSYLLCAENEEIQNQRFQKILKPLLNHSFSNWRETRKNEYVIKIYFGNLSDNIIGNLKEYVLKENVAIPVQLFTNIVKELNDNLSLIENYSLIRKWTLAADFVHCISEFKSVPKPATEEVAYAGCPDTDNDIQWNLLFSKSIIAFAQKFTEQLNLDVKNYFPSIFHIFSVTFEDVLNNICVDEINRYKLYKTALESTNAVHIYLVAVLTLPNYCYKDELKVTIEEMRRIILAHPSEEVKMHYFWRFPNYVCEK